MSLETGKTNHGSTLYGRGVRHKNVKMCFVGAFSMYLGYRFHLTREFEVDSFPLENWLDNSTWFDIKLLVDAARHDADRTKEMNPNAYARPVKETMDITGTISRHFCHVGRNLGARILESYDVEGDKIRQLGNWNPSIQESYYSTKLPWEPMRKMGGWGANYYNPRATVNIPPSLLIKTPFGVFYEKHLPFLQDQQHGINNPTALKFCELMVDVAGVFLQDMAALCIEDPQRMQGHPLYNLPCFQCREWTVSRLVKSFFLSLDWARVSHQSPSELGISRDHANDFVNRRQIGDKHRNGNSAS